ncbi:MAG: hypothetical protein DRQ55_02415 [Planctomycetota bacterium]|nr:MAG: hypothetical protein DRQ55_02415 [Planctomycetota bacterium]
MSVTQRTALGLDVSDGTLKAVLLARSGRRVRLIRSWRARWAGAADEAAGLRQALRRFLSEMRPGILPRIVVSAPDADHLGSTYTVPVMQAERMDELVRYELLRATGASQSELLMGHHVRKGVAENQVHAVALRRARVDQLVSLLSELGVPFDELQPPSWALASFIEHERPLGRDRIVLGVGELSTTLLLMREDGLWSRHLPIGLSHVADEQELARRLHAEAASAITHCVPRDRAFHPADVVLTEEAALSGSITSALKRAFGLPVTRVAELLRIEPPRRTRRGSPSSAESLCMGRAYGLGLAGLGLARVSGRFDVADDPRRALRRRLPVVSAGLATAALALLILTELSVGHADALAAAMPPSVGQSVLTSAARARELESGRARQQLRLSRLSALARRASTTFAARRALAAVSEVAAGRGELPLHVESCWLSAGAAGRPGLLKLTLESSPAFDAMLGEQLEPALLRHGLSPRRITHTPNDTAHPLSSWRVEVELP